MLILCSYVDQVLKEVESLIGLKDVWRYLLIEKSLKIWCENGNLMRYKVLLIIITCGI
jgi:hypothetical protein